MTYSHTYAKLKTEWYIFKQWLQKSTRILRCLPARRHIPTIACTNINAEVFLVIETIKWFPGFRSKGSAIPYYLMQLYCLNFTNLLLFSNFLPSSHPYPPPSSPVPLLLSTNVRLRYPTVIGTRLRIHSQRLILKKSVQWMINTRLSPDNPSILP